VVCVLALSACRVDATVTVDVADDGSGTVTARVELDAEAVRAAERGGLKLENSVRLGDLEAAGWDSTGWERVEGGGANLEVSKDFARASEAGAVVDELSGPDGPLQDFEVERDPSTFSTEWSFFGVGDLGNLKPGISTDADLVARLTASRIDVEDLEAQVLLKTAESLRLRVVADLPATSARTFDVPPGTSITMRDSSSETSKSRVLMFVGGFAIAVIAVVVLVAGEARDRRRRQLARAPRSSTWIFDDPPDPEE
jgi:hypothetical protein